MKQITRSRPYKKDDNAHIEQKNFTHVKKIFGYARYDSQEACEAMNDLYRHELRWFMNFFLPSVKLVKKIQFKDHLKKDLMLKFYKIFLNIIMVRFLNDLTWHVIPAPSGGY